MNSSNSMIPRCLSILKDQFSVQSSDRFESLLEGYRELLLEWNPYANLMSDDDLGSRFDEHVCDSLCLAPYVLRFALSGASWVDIGSGGGFPAFPLRFLLSEIPLVMVERSAKKHAFLMRVCGVLELESVVVIHDSFPECELPGGECVFTARAVEKPDTLLTALSKDMTGSSVFLCQRGGAAPSSSTGFSFEEVSDAFDECRLRRGKLYLGTKSP